MSGAQNWSVRGIDPKVREAAREAAARQGMSLGEYLSLALQKHQSPGPVGASAVPPASAQTPRRTPRITAHPYDEDDGDDDDWHVGIGGFARGADASRISQRVEAIERRTQLAITGLDRAISTIDRSVLGLAARLEYAENVSRESADRIAEALDHFRVAGDTLDGRLERAEHEVVESRRALDSAKLELSAARERLESQVVTAEDIARKAEAATRFITSELANQEAALGHRLGALEDKATDTVTRALTEARAAAEQAAREASAATTEALAELRELNQRIARRIDESETSTQRAVNVAIEEARGVKASLTSEIARLEQQLEGRGANDHAVATLSQSHARLTDRVAEHVEEARGVRERLNAEIARLEQRIASGGAGGEIAADGTLYEALGRLSERIAAAEGETKSLRDTVLEEVVRIESEIGGRIASAEALKADHAALITRIERAEVAARESTAGLRQAAGAAISDLRNAQLGLAARLKQVEDAAGRSGALDLADLRTQHGEIVTRLAALETRPQTHEALAAFEKRIDDIAARVDARTAITIEGADASPVNSALAAFEARLAQIAREVGESAAREKLEEVGGAVKTLDTSLQRLAERVAETETTANSAIRTLEQTVSELSSRVDGGNAAQETEALRALLETRLDEMSQSVTHMVGAARNDLASQIEATLTGSQDALGLEAALEDTNRRLAAAERRQAQTIEAISLEIKRMSETVDRRLRAVENRSDEGASTAVREELSRMAHALEARFEEIEHREAAAFDRMGLEVGRLSERLEERVGAVESRSAQAIEQVGDQVARMADRFNQRHEMLSRELGERMLDSEERSGARVSEAISSVMQRLGEVEERSADAVAPVQKAVSNIATRLEGLESDTRGPSGHEVFSTTAFDDFPPAHTFGSPTPLQSAQPLRAAPLPPLSRPHETVTPSDEHDIYFAEDIIAEDMPVVETPAPSPAVYAESTPYIAIEGDDDDIDFAPVDDIAPSAPLTTAHPSETDVDPFLDDVDAFAPPPPEDEDPFWTPDATHAAATPETATHAADGDVFDLDLDGDVDAPATAAPGRNDYLNAARRAAQAQAEAKAKPKKEKKEKKKAAVVDPDAAPAYSLRGSSRIVLWGAASAITVLALGGAWYLNQQQEARRAPPAQPEPDVVPPTQALPPPAEPYDPALAAPLGGEGVTPEGAPVEGAAPTTAAPAAAAPAAAAPVARNNTRAPAAAVAAGPLPARQQTLEAAAQGGDLVAQYELGLQRIANGRAADGVALLRRSADGGMAMAQYRLAKLYERGEGVPANLNEARRWTERAAAAGNRRAMHDLGVYFARGEGAPLDEAAAFRWFRQAAELGVADSQYNLGVLYQQGRGVGASASEAMFWFLVAARQGDSDASQRATTLEAQLTPVQVEQARSRAASFRPRAASAAANGEFGPRPWAPARPAA